MSDYLNIETLDPSGDIRNAAEDAGAFDSAGMDRRAMLRRGAAAGGGLIVAGGLFQTMLSPAEAAISKTKKSKKNDGAILNYALTLEFLEAAFYTQGSTIAFTDPNYAYFATTVKGHEVAHVAALQATLKKLKIKAISAPEVAFGAAVTDQATFLATAKVLEDTGVAAYAGQVTNILQAPILAAAASIHSVEARHAAWIRFLLGGGVAASGTANAPAPNIVDAPLTEKAVLSAVKATKFVPALG